MIPILLLVISNVFMTLAWYGHLQFKGPHLKMWHIILVSWGIAFFEYCFQVPANRWGEQQFTLVQLKVLQEVISLLVFSVFAVSVMGVRLGLNHFAAFLLLIAAVFLVRR